MGRGCASSGALAVCILLVYFWERHFQQILACIRTQLLQPLLPHFSLLFFQNNFALAGTAIPVV